VDHSFSKGKNMLRKNIILAILLSSALGACVKKRPDINGQAQNIEDLKLIPTTVSSKSADAYTYSECHLKTTDKVLPEVEKNTESEKVITNHPQIKLLDALEFTTDCPYLADNMVALEFRGEPNTEYRIQLDVEPNNLVVYKIVKETEITHYEKPYSTKSGGNWYVPVGGFAINGFYNVEKARNADNKETNQKIKVFVDRKDFKLAKYFSIDEKKFERFETENKKDVLPLSYFQGEWYFQRTVVRKRYGANTSIGAGSSEGVDGLGNFIDAGRIEFVVRNNNIYGISTNIDEKLKKQMLDSGDKLNAIIPVSIPGETVSYKREEVGDTLGLKEVEIKTELDKGEYFKLDAVNIQANADDVDSIMSALFTLDGRKELKEIKIEDGYIDFVVEKGRTGELVRYSFRKVDEKSNYQTRQAFEDDMRKFGYFTSSKHQIFDERTARRDDLEKRNFISRFNPNENIVYHFSSATSKEKWVRDVGREAVNLWQQAFVKAGLKIKILIDDQNDKELGDIRYNLLNIITDDTGDNGGFGPSFKDALTGEVVSAVSNIYTSGDRDIFFRQLRAYIAEEIGYQPNFFVLGENTTISPLVQSLNASITNNLVKINEEGKVVPIDVFKWRDPKTQSGFVYAPLVEESQIVGKKILKQNAQFVEIESYDQFYKMMMDKDSMFNSIIGNAQLTDAGVFLGQGSYSSFNEIKDSQERIYDKAMVDFAKEKCPTVIKFIAEMKVQDRLPKTEEENIALWPCVSQLMQYQALGNLMHEMGHNLGLRHNFMGSVDKRNFMNFGEYTNKYIQLDNPFTNQVGSSSIMDYVPWPTYSQVAPSGYDLAAIRFGYLGVVEAEGAANPGQGNYVDVPNGVKIENQFVKVGKKPRDYKFCEDLNARYLKTDTFCSVHDYGTTAVEMAKFVADVDIRDLGRAALRIDKTGVPDSISNGRSLTRMKEFYDEWRSIVASHVGIKRRYLQGISQEEYQKIVDQLLNDPVNGEKNKDLFKTRNLFVNLALDYAFLPNKYCRVTKASGEEILLELTLIKQDIQVSNKQGAVSSCSDELVSDFLTAHKYTLVDEVGHYLEGGSFSLDPLRLLDVRDYAGTGILKLTSFAFLTQRITPSYFNLMVTNFTPNTIDEPDVRDAVTNLLVLRALNGAFVTTKKINLDDYANTTLINEDLIHARLNQNKTNYLNFSEEAKYIQAMFSILLNGLNVPGDPTASGERINPFVTRVTNDTSIIQQSDADYLEYQSGRYLYMTKGNYISKALLDKLKALRAESQSTQILEQKFEPAIFEQNKPVVKQEFSPYLFVDKKANVAQLVNLYQKIVTTVDSLQKDPQLKPVAQMLTYIFGPELDFLTKAVIPKLVVPTLQKNGIEASDEVFQALIALAPQVVKDSQVPSFTNQTELKAMSSSFWKMIPAGAHLLQNVPMLKGLGMSLGASNVVANKILNAIQSKNSASVQEETVKEVVVNVDDKTKRVLLSILAVDVSDAAKGSKVDLVATADELSGRVDQFIVAAKQNFEEQVVKAQAYLENKNELDAQSDLLFQMLMISAGQ
jgi:hypothetical protein